MSRITRYSSIIPPDHFATPLFIAGIGAIGRAVATLAAQSGYTNLVIVDFDTVGEENYGPQGYRPDQLGAAKIDALAADLALINPDCRVVKFNDRITPTNCPDFPPSAIFISCMDSMSARSAFFDWWANSSSPLFIDTRMAAEVFQSYIMDRDTDFEHYRKTIFPDSAGHDAPCTARATAYCAALAGSHVLCLLSQHSRKIDLPFFLEHRMSDHTLTTEF